MEISLPARFPTTPMSCPSPKIDGGIIAPARLPGPALPLPRVDISLPAPLPQTRIDLPTGVPATTVYFAGGKAKEKETDSSWLAWIFDGGVRIPTPEPVVIEPRGQTQISVRTPRAKKPRPTRQPKIIEIEDGFGIER
jgi:hypothetical protein